MAYNPDIHHRRSIRLKGYDYACGGVYFFTLCAQNRECLFGEIVAGEMRLNDVGTVVKSAWEGVPDRFPSIELDMAIIMPNHFHGIICITDRVGAPLAAPAFKANDSEIGAGKGAGMGAGKGAASSAPTLGAIVRAFKSMSAVLINRLIEKSGQPLWQRNYYERILRNEGELTAARKYIAENPLKWDQDRENPINAV